MKIDKKNSNGPHTYRSIQKIALLTKHLYADSVVVLVRNLGCCRDGKVAVLNV